MVFLAITSVVERFARPALIVLWIFVLSIGAAATIEKKSPNVLFLVSNDSGLPANIEILKGLRSALSAEGPPAIQTFDEYLDVIRFPGKDQEDVMAAFLEKRFASTGIDLVIVLGPQALKFLVERRQNLFPNVPIVFAGVREETVKSLSLPANATGIVSQFNPVKTLELALTLQPDVQHVVVITGASVFDKTWEATAKELYAPFERRLPITFLGGLPLDQLLRKVAALPPNSAIVYLSMFQDGAGQQFRPVDVAEKISLAANAPVYGVYDTYVGRGIVGGYMDTFEAVGRETGRLALQVLRGEQSQTISPHEAETHRFIADWRQVTRWNLNAAALPQGTDIRFREPTAWEQYKAPILLTLAVLALQSFLLVKLYAEVRSRRHAQQLAEESKEWMDAAVTGADLGLWSWSSDTDTVWATKRCRKLLGLNTDGHLTREAFLECLRPEDRSLALERISVAMKTGEICVAEYGIALPQGSTRWVLSKAIPKRRQNGVADHLTGVILDITERKRNEAETARQRQELAHLSRVSVVGALAGALAHELNQPLTAILSNAQAASRMLARKSGDVAEIQNILSDIVEDDKRAGDVIHHLRSLLRKDQATRERIDANELVSSVLGLCHSDLVIKNVAVVKQLGKEIPSLLGDSVQLRQVLLNLIVNSCDAMASKPASERLLIVSTERRSDLIRFSVTDSGSGISAGAIEELFQPFFTTKSLGMGLGLPICQWIVTAHGGRLSGYNNRDGGATFSFELPCYLEGSHDEAIASRIPS